MTTKDGLSDKIAEIKRLSKSCKFPDTLNQLGLWDVKFRHDDHNCCDWKSMSHQRPRNRKIVERVLQFCVEYVHKLPNSNILEIIKSILMDYKTERIREINNLFKQGDFAWFEDRVPLRNVEEYENRNPNSNVVDIASDITTDWMIANDTDYESDSDEPFPW